MGTCVVVGAGALVVAGGLAVVGELLGLWTVAVAPFVTVTGSGVGELYGLVTVVAAAAGLPVVIVGAVVDGAGLVVVGGTAVVADMVTVKAREVVNKDDGVAMEESVGGEVVASAGVVVAEVDQGNAIVGRIEEISSAVE